MSTRSAAHMNSEKQHDLKTAGPLTCSCSSELANNSLDACQLKAKAAVRHHSQCRVPGPAWMKRSRFGKDHLSAVVAQTMVLDSSAVVGHHRHEAQLQTFGRSSVPASTSRGAPLAQKCGTC